MKKTIILVAIGALLGSTIALAASKFFSDVPAGQWYSGAVASLSEKGIISGYSDGTFGTGKNVSRAEVAVMLDKTIQYLQTGKIVSSLCTASPTPTDIGRDVYPVDPKYGSLNFLGELFTAFNCGQDRVSKIFGVEGDNYTLGSAVWLKSNPSQNLINQFKAIGFTCGDGAADASCKKWELQNTVKVTEIIKLEPYYENFEAADCRNCG